MPPTWASAMVCLGDSLSSLQDRRRLARLPVSFDDNKMSAGGERLAHGTCQPRSVRDAVEGVGREDEVDGA